MLPEPSMARSLSVVPSGPTMVGTPVVELTHPSTELLSATQTVCVDAAAMPDVASNPARAQHSARERASIRILSLLANDGDQGSSAGPAYGILPRSQH